MNGNEDAARADRYERISGQLAELFRKRGRTLVLVTHSRAVSRIADRVAVLDAGTIRLHGTLEELLGSDEPARIPEGLFAALQAAGASFVDLADPVLFPIMNAPLPVPEPPACCLAAGG